MFKCIFHTLYQVPMALFVPHIVEDDKDREIVVKVSINGDGWKTILQTNLEPKTKYNVSLNLQQIIGNDL